MRKLALSFLLIATLVARVALASSDPFIGDWKLDSAQSHYIDQMKVEPLGLNKYAFDFGGAAEPITIDGTDQPGYGGTLLAVSAQGPDAWRVVRKQEGKVILHADWKLSQDGNSLNDAFTSIGSDGTANTQHLVYARTAGTSGFAGTWERNATIDPFVITVQPDKAGGLALSYLGKTKDLSFDGKDHAPVGQGVFQGATFSARRTGPTGLEVTDKYQGKVIDTQEIDLSPDRKTLTLTIHKPGHLSPDVLVFLRQ